MELPSAIQQLSHSQANSAPWRNMVILCSNHMKREELLQEAVKYMVIKGCQSKDE